MLPYQGTTRQLLTCITSLDLIELDVFTNFLTISCKGSCQIELSVLNTVHLICAVQIAVQKENLILSSKLLTKHVEEAISLAKRRMPLT